MFGLSFEEQILATKLTYAGTKNESLSKTLSCRRVATTLAMLANSKCPGVAIRPKKDELLNSLHGEAEIQTAISKMTQINRKKFCLLSQMSQRIANLSRRQTE